MGKDFFDYRNEYSKKEHTNFFLYFCEKLEHYVLDHGVICNVDSYYRNRILGGIMLKSIELSEDYDTCFTISKDLIKDIDYGDIVINGDNIFEYLDDTPLYSAGDPLDLVIYKEISENIRKVFNSLPADCNEILSKIIFKNYTYQDFGGEKAQDIQRKFQNALALFGALFIIEYNKLYPKK